jgi:L-lactate dehydrogenase complex protein LldG
MLDLVDALFEAFRVHAEAVSAEVHRVATPAQARDFVTRFLSAEADGGATAVWADVPLLGTETGQEACPTAAAKVGISQMDWAIADTGTLVQNATPIERRLVSTLPSIHIALVPTKGLVPDLASAIAKLHPKPASYISMITGPSRTADIERVLTIGVHGPARLVIVFVDESGAN